MKLTEQVEGTIEGRNNLDQVTRGVADEKGWNEVSTSAEYGQSDNSTYPYRFVLDDSQKPTNKTEFTRNLVATSPLPNNTVCFTSGFFTDSGTTLMGRVTWVLALDANGELEEAEGMFDFAGEGEPTPGTARPPFDIG